MRDQRRGPGRFSETYPPERRRVPIEHWPEPDRVAFQWARREGGMFESPGPAASWAPQSCRMRQGSYGRFLNFLKRKGLLLETEGPSDRMTPSRLTPYLAEATHLLAATTIERHLVDLRLMLGAMAPDEDWRWITRHPGRPSSREI